MKKYRIIHIILSILFIYTFASFSTPIHAEEKESNSFDTYELIKIDEKRVVKTNSIEDRIDYLLKFPSVCRVPGELKKQKVILRLPLKFLYLLNMALLEALSN